MNILLRLPIYAKTQGVLLAGARRTVQYACAPYSPRHLSLFVHLVTLATNLHE